MSRPVRRWVKPAIVISAGAVMLAATVPITLAMTLGASSPAIVRRVAPFDARSAATIAYLGATSNPQQWVRWDALADQALHRDPTVVLAAVTRGMIAEQRGDPASTLRWLHYADRLSRRDLTTQLWFIEQRVQAGDVQGALARYDVALRASPEASPILYPILTRAASTPEVATALNQLLRHRPSWGAGFTDHFIQNSSDWPAMVRVTSGVINRDPINGPAQLSALVGRLVSVGQFDLAWDTYRDFTGVKQSDATVRDDSFADPSPISAFEWTYADGQALSPERGLEGGRTVLYLPTAPDRDGDAARQLIRFRAGGKWQLSALVSAGEPPVADVPRLALRCAAAPGQVLANLPFPPSSSPSTVKGEFTVPGSCRYAWLSVALRQPAEAIGDIRAYITKVGLRQL